MNSTYFSFLRALMDDVSKNVVSFFQGKSGIADHFASYQDTFQAYASGFGPFGWTLYILSILFVALLISGLALLVVYFAKKIPLLKNATSASLQKENESLQLELGRYISQGAAPFATKEEEPVVDEPRFPKLLEIDSRYASASQSQKDDDVSLKDIGDGFRNYAAHAWGLYYSPNVIRYFLAGLASTHLLILEGVSGTGKTSLPCRFGEYLGGKCSVIPVEPSWREKSELLGYYNDFSRQYRQTPFLETLYEALYCEGVQFIVLDEMNLSRIEYYFAEFLSLLELPDASKRLIPLVNFAKENDPKLLVDGAIPLGDNIYFIGTANHDDSTFAITDKVYDRAIAIPFESKATPFEAKESAPLHVSHKKLRELFDQARELHQLPEEDQAKFASLMQFTQARFHCGIGNRMDAQFERFIPVYLSMGGKGLDALDFLYCNKVLRKLDVASLADGINDLYSKIETLFGSDSFPLSQAWLRQKGAL